MISNLLLHSKKLNQDEYLIVKDVLSKSEKELLNEVVFNWKKVEQENTNREQMIKHFMEDN